MKKIGLFLGVLVALLTASCSNILVSDGDGGSISLVIDGATAQSIRSAGALRSTTGGSTYTLTASIRGDYTATQSVSSSADGLGAVTFTFERVPAGKSIILDLAATVNGSYIWYGNSGKHTVKRGENQLQIAVGRVSGVLLWNNTSVKIVPYGNLGETGTQVVGVQTMLPSWCFDNKGNLYVAQTASTGAQRYDLQADGTYPSSASANYLGPSISALSYDNVTGILYGIGDDGSLQYWQTGGGSSGSSRLSILDAVGFAAHNNIIYTATFNAVENEGWKAQVTLSKYEVDSGGVDPSLQKIITLPDAFLTISRSAPTGQMIYKDGALYLLLGSFSVSSSTTDTEGQSCGALLRINPSTLTLDTSFGSNGYLGLASERTISGTYIDDPYSMKLYSPTESDESRAFYGPVGFVAVMPKKLVIADAGYALSKGSNDQLRARRKNRVVTVDLETQAFAGTSLSDTGSYGNVVSSCGFLVVN